MKVAGDPFPSTIRLNGITPGCRVIQPEDAVIVQFLPAIHEAARVRRTPAQGDPLTKNDRIELDQEFVDFTNELGGQVSTAAQPDVAVRVLRLQTSHQSNRVA